MFGGIFLLFSDDRPLAKQIGEKAFRNLFMEVPAEDAQAYCNLSDRDYVGYEYSQKFPTVYRATEKEGFPKRKYSLQMP